MEVSPTVSCEGSKTVADCAHFRSNCIGMPPEREDVVERHSQVIRCLFERDLCFTDVNGVLV